MKKEIYIRLKSQLCSWNETASHMHPMLPFLFPLSSFVPRDSITIAGSLINIRNIPRNYPRGNSILITPPIIAQLTLPRPEDPAIGILLIFRDLRRKPLAVEGLLRTRVPRTGPLNIIWDAKTEFADNGRCFVVAVAVVVARVCQVAGLGDSD